MDTEERLGRIEAMLLRSGQQQAETARAIGQLIIKVDGLVEEVGNLNQEILQYIEKAQAEREVFQTESRRIWVQLNHDE